MTSNLKRLFVPHKIFITSFSQAVGLRVQEETDLAKEDRRSTFNRVSEFGGGSGFISAAKPALPTENEAGRSQVNHCIVVDRTSNVRFTVKLVFVHLCTGGGCTHGAPSLWLDCSF